MALPFIIGGLGLAEGFLNYASSYSAAKELELQAEAHRVRKEFEKKALDKNARIADIQVKDAEERGRKVAASIYRQGKRVEGTQRARIAAQGVRTDTGSAMDVQEQTRGVVDRDMLTVKNNAWNEAFGHKVQAEDLRSAAQMAELEGKAGAAALRGKASATRLGGAISLLGAAGKSSAYVWDQYKDLK